jgi:hypothetical protein
MDLGIGYEGGDDPPVDPEGYGWIEFDLSTDRYRKPSRHNRVRIKLSAIDG